MVQGKTTETPKKDEKVLQQLALGKSIAAACRAGRIGRATYYRWRGEDPAFAALADEAIEEGTDLLEDEAQRRAIRRKAPSDTLLIFLLKGRRPDKYRERYESKVTIDIRTAAEKVAADLNVPIDVVISEAYRMVEDGQA